MNRFTSRQLMGVGMVVMIGAVSCLAWLTFFRTIAYPDPRSLAGALLLFSVLGIVFFLGMVVWEKRLLQVMATALILAPSLYFVHVWYYIGLLFVCMLIMLVSLRSVQEEMADRLSFRFFRTVRAGSFLVILGLSLGLSGAYYASIERESWEELVPRFSIGDGTVNVLFKAIAYLYPKWRTLDDDGVTVDAFLVSLPRDETVSTMPLVAMSGSGVAPELAEYLKQEIAVQAMNSGATLSQEVLLEVGREQIGVLAGRSVEGDEKIADVFSVAIQRKVVALLNGEQATEHVSPEIVPVILTVLFFLTLLPLGSVLVVVWITFSLLLFHGALWLGWVKLERVAKEQETLLP